MKKRMRSVPQAPLSADAATASRKGGQKLRPVATPAAMGMKGDRPRRSESFIMMARARVTSHEWLFPAVKAYTTSMTERIM